MVAKWEMWWLSERYGSSVGCGGLVGDVVAQREMWLLRERYGSLVGDVVTQWEK